MEPLAGLSLPLAGLWKLASLSRYAADRGMAVKPRFDSGGSSTPKGVMEPLAGFEPATLSLRMRCSTN